MDLFEKKYGRKDILLAYKSDKIIPKEGSFEGIKYYSFHGVGIYVKLDNAIIDFDFGPDNRFDGFDVMRLFQFAQSKSDLYSFYTSEKSLKVDFDNLIELGKIYNPQTSPSPHNYYWRT